MKSPAVIPLRVVLCAALAGATGVRTADCGPAIPKTVESSGLELVTPETQTAIDNGLAYLAARQNDDGSFGSGRTYRRDVAVTSLSAMAFMSAGHTPRRGKYGKNVEKALEFILSRCESTGFIVSRDSEYHGPMYGHGFATLFLAEIYGMTHQKQVRKKLEKAVRLIIDSQNKEGGWRYDPKPKDADVSVTVCQIMALRAARNAGISVPKTTVKACEEYVKQCQNTDGGFRYQLVHRQQSQFGRSAAGVVTLYSAGIYKGREIDRGLAWLMRYLPRNEPLRFQRYYFYGHYYAVQAMWHAGGRYWQLWYPAIRNELLSAQSSNGGWSERLPRYATICSEYNTAMACLILQMPNNFLPIFQR